MEEALIQLAVAELPNIVGGIKALFKKQNPDAPPVTDAQVFAALNNAYFSSLAKDDAILNQG
jgi:hypothetical protein